MHEPCRSGPSMSSKTSRKSGFPGLFRCGGSAGRRRAVEPRGQAGGTALLPCASRPALPRSARQQLTTHRRDAAALRNEATRAADSARAKLAMALRRGTMKRGMCQYVARLTSWGSSRSRSGGGTWHGSAGAIEMRLESGSVPGKPRLLAPVNEQLGPMNGRRCSPRSSFFRRMSGRSCTHSQGAGPQAGRSRLMRRCM